MYPLDYLISNSLKKSVVHVDGEYLVWNDIYAGKINADIAIYGSSRAWTHIDPEILKDSLGLSAYNFGIDGLNFSLQYFRHKEYFKYNKRPEIIIVSGDIFTFEEEEGFYNHEQALPYMLFNKDYFESRELFKIFEKADFFIPLKRYLGQTWEMARAAILAIGLENEPPARIKGFMGIEREWSQDLLQAIKTKGNLKIKIDYKLLCLFMKFVKECKENNIKVILVYSPEYIEGRTFIVNREDVLGLWYRIAASRGLTFLDYTEDSIGKNRDYFYNSTHLNKQGSKLFSQKFAGDLKKLL
ncbi:MAG TPA: hypothetical protein PKN32_00450 [Bacteroidales bacterium]|nr:hypothetical protein [Bacteroidales bacterium]